MNIVFCADHGVWHALHAAMFSVVSRFSESAGVPHIHLVGNGFGPKDQDLLRATLLAAGKPSLFTIHAIDESLFKSFKPLNGSLGAYYKLILPELLRVERYLYLDADVICDVDVSPLGNVDLQDLPLGWVGEAPLHQCADPAVGRRLGMSPADQYFNSGVLLVESAAWRKADVTGRCLDFLASNEALIREQSALNVVLYGKTKRLDECFNSIANMRRHWPSLKKGYGKTGKLLHFVDYPKPWDFLGEIVHPHFGLWRGVLASTAVNHFRSWERQASRKIPKSSSALSGYKKSFKDKVLFTLYSKGICLPKGVPSDSSE
jgi:lipopolysaccharide biosynthesis glycosyltransferase